MFEIFTPIYNFVTGSVSGGLIEVLRFKLLIDDDNNRKNLAIHAAGNLRQHEGPSTRNMCM